MSLRFCVVVSVVSLACGGGTPAPRALSSSWQAPAILSHIPADSPYVFATLAPMNDDVRRRIYAGLDRGMSEALRKLEEAKTESTGPRPAWLRAVLAFSEEVRNKPVQTWAEHFGLDPNGTFAFYGLSVWPVVRIELSNPGRLRAAIERVVAATGTQPLKQETFEGRRYWVTALDKLSFVAAVLDREAVVALLPTPSLPSALPIVLGTKTPAQNLASTSAVPELMGRHHFVGPFLAYLDLHNALEVLTRQQPSELDAPVRALSGPISEVCRTDLERLVAVAPRIATGYRRLDATGFDTAIVIETSANVSRGFANLRAAVPEVTAASPGHPLFAVGMAANPAAVIGWLRGIATDLHDHPFTCPWLNGLNSAGTKLASGLEKPLPPMMQGLRGFALIVDNATIVPPSVDGHLVIAGDRIADTLSAVTAMMPILGGLSVPKDGRPIALPLQQLGIPIPSAHLAMSADRLVIAAGTNSAQRASQHIASPVPARSPLFMFGFDTPRLQQLLKSIGQSDPFSFDNFGDLWLSFDAGDDGLVFDIAGTWGAPSAPTAPPSP